MKPHHPSPLIAGLLCFSFLPCLSAAETQQQLFEIQHLFKDVRIPKIVVANDGAVLAFAKNCSLLRRSGDAGKTWSETQTLPAKGANALVDGTTGEILLVSAGAGFLHRSRDHGVTWSKEEIVIQPNAMGHGTPDGVHANVGASESGITLKFGKHKGRLLLPARIQPPKGDNAQEFWPYNYNTSIFSDDRGKIWQIGGPVQSGTGEGTLAELADGRIYYNSRSHMAVDHRRRIAWSHDGGAFWSDWEVSNDLFEVGEPFYFKYGTKPSYGCNAGLVRIPDEATRGKEVLLFSTLDNPGKGRVKMTVWASFDSAKTWPVKRLVYAGPCAYSSLSADKTGNIYLLFENGEKKLYERISIARFNLAWLQGARKATSAKEN